MEEWTHLSQLSYKHWETLIQIDGEDMKATSLSVSDIKTLEEAGNKCSDWSIVKILRGPTTIPAIVSEKIRNCTFQPNLDKSSDVIILGSNFSSCTDISLDKSTLKHRMDCGLYDSTFVAPCVALSDSLVYRCLAVRGAVIGHKAALINCTFVGADLLDHSRVGKRAIGLEMEINLGPESDGRSIEVDCNTSYAEVCAQFFEQEKQQSIKTEKTSLLMTVLSDHAQVLNCRQVKNCFVGSHALVTDCKVIDNCFIASSMNTMSKLTGCDTVQDCIINSSCTVDSALVVEGVMMFSYSSIGCGAIVHQSIFGPDSSLQVNHVYPPTRLASICCDVSHPTRRWASATIACWVHSLASITRPC